MIADLQNAYINAVERVGASTVNVSTAGAAYGPPFGRPWPRRGFGSGVLLDGQGHVLTTHHVIDGDDETDIAIIKVDGKDFHAAEFADSDQLKVGQPVLAIGNPLGLPGGPTVTSGVISSLRRNLSFGPGDGLPVIQTDAAVNPGNSGGPLVDLQGRVVAINTATIPYAEGIGFAIPINAALGVARQILEHGHVQRPWLGVAGYDVDRRVAAYYGITSRQGVFLAEVSSGSPAEAAGLQVGDVLTSLGGRALGGVADLVDGLRERAIGDTIDIQAERRGQALRVKAKLASRPF